MLHRFDDEVTVYSANPVRQADCKEPASRQHEGQHSKERTESPRAGLPARLRGRQAGPETSQRLCLRSKSTKETLLLPMVGLRPIVVSRPTLFALVRQDDFNEPSSQHECALNKEHAESPEHAQPAHGKGAFELIPDSGNRSPLVSV